MAAPGGTTAARRYPLSTKLEKKNSEEAKPNLAKKRAHSATAALSSTMSSTCLAAANRRTDGRTATRERESERRDREIER